MMRATQSLGLYVLMIAAPLAAQDKEKLCNDIQHRPMRVGQWASYDWTGGRNGTSSMRMAIVGTEAVSGKPYYWYEVAINEPAKGSKGRTIVQLLIPGLGEAASVHGMVVKTGDEPAMRMPEQMMSMVRGQISQNFATEFAGKCAAMEVVGWEQITVPAGAFRALHLRNAADQTDAWIVPDIYFGLVQVKLKDGSSMALAGRGTDGKSSITETPVTMPGLPR